MLIQLQEFLKTVYFDDPEYFILLILPAILTVFWIVFFVVKKLSTIQKTYGSQYPKVGGMIFWLAIPIATTLIIVSLARPKSIDPESLRGNLEIIVLLDKTMSMRAQDMRPTNPREREQDRLGVAKEIVMTIISGNLLKDGDRVALFIFGKNAAPKLSLTTDFDRFATDVKNLHFPRSLLDESLWETDMALALRFLYIASDQQDAVEKDVLDIRRNRERINRIALLFSDGDFGVKNDTLLSQSITELKKRGIKVFTFGIGTIGGVTLSSTLRWCYPPQLNQQGNADDGCYRETEHYHPWYVEDWDKETTALETETLNHIAQQTGGELFIVENQGEETYEFLKTVIAKSRPRLTLVDAYKSDNDTELWWIPTLAALVMLIGAYAIKPS